MGQSTKPAGEYIGYKGLGFRAVLEITDKPEIYSGSYQFGFSQAETLALLKANGSDPHLDSAQVPVLTVPFERSSTNPNLSQNERDTLQRLQQAGYATIVRLPLKPTPLHLYADVREMCQQLMTDHTLLFLPYISELSLALPDTHLTISKTSRELVVKPTSLSKLVRVSRLSFKKTEVLRPRSTKKGEAVGEFQKDSKSKPTLQDWLLVEASQAVVIDDPTLVQSLEDTTWREVRQVGLATAFPLARLPWGGSDVFLKRRVEPLPFFAHFPTQEGSGLGFAVHADFYLSASRKQIEWEAAYNQWLSNQLITFICGPALDVVHYLYPDDAALVEILADYAFHNDRFGRAFREVLDNRLRLIAFVPIGNSNYSQPAQVVWTPLGQDGVLVFRRVFRYLGDVLHYPVLQLEEVHTNTNPTTSASHASKSSEKSYDTDAYSDDEPYSSYSNDSYSSSREDDNYSYKEKEAETASEFDYARIRRFLSMLGVRKLSPTQLSQIYPQALQNWQNGLLLTGEICAALALWYAELGKFEDSWPAQRRLVEQARTLPVLPTLNFGWQAPDNHAFVFVESPSTFISPFKDMADLKPDVVITLDADQSVAEIDPAAYYLAEYSELIKLWHRALGLR
jgi:hypothetical protein